MSAAALRSETHILDLSSVGGSLLSPAARYTRGLEDQTSRADVTGAQDPSPSAAVVLVFLHGLGFHKETWEPTISHLFELERTSREQCSSAPTLVEVWSIDCPDHGDAATLNHIGSPSRISLYAYGKSLLALLKSGHVARPQGCRVILAGHSAGALSLLLTASQVVEQGQAISAMVLVEPWMAAAVEGDPAMQKLTRELIHGASLRRDVWNSRAEANSYFKSHPAFRHWDARVHQVYADHALRSLPTRDYPLKETGVTLAFPKRLESQAYGQFDEGRDALRQMPLVSAATRVHLVFGAQQPSIVKAMQRSICDHAGKTASVTYLPAVGHAAPQQAPELVAKAIWGMVWEPTVRGLPVSQGKL